MEFLIGMESSLTPYHHEKSWEILAKKSTGFYLRIILKRVLARETKPIIGSMLGWSDDKSEIINWGNRKEEIYREIGIKEGIPLINGSRNFITELHNHSIPLVIGTSTERKNIELAIEQNKLEGMFAGAVCSEDVSKGKPD